MDARRIRGAVGTATFMVACAACLFAPGFALAGTLDQQQTEVSGSAFSIGTNQNVAQTFTAGISGRIDEVDLHLGYLASAPTAPLTVEIRSTSGGVPTSTVVASSSIPAAADTTASGVFIPVTFASQASVDAGTQYAIVASSLTPVSNTWEWDDVNTNPYAGGTALYMAPPGSGSWTNAATSDLAFKTYVVPTPPVPAPSVGPTGERAAAFKACKKRAHKRHWSHKRLKKCRKHAALLPV